MVVYHHQRWKVNTLKERKTHRTGGEVSWILPSDRTGGCGSHMIRAGQCSDTAAAAAAGTGAVPVPFLQLPVLGGT